MRAHRRNQEDLRIATEAAEWLDRLEEQGAKEHAAFASWLAASPRHIEAVLEVTAMDRLLEEADPQRHIDIDRLMAAAKAPNVVPLMDAVGRDRADASHGKTLSRRQWATAAALAMLAIGAGLGAWGWLSGESFVTDIGEQRAIRLSDGSTVNLSARSEVKLRFSDNARELLLTGEALFKVERDPARPFRVNAGVAVIQAIGTQFNVYRRPSGTVVSVLEGAVLAESSSETVQLNAGEEARIDNNGHIDSHPLPVNGAIAGRRQGRLIFSDDRLEDIAAEFNRWNERQLRIGDETLAGDLYSGAFDADDPQSFVAFLRRDRSLAFDERRKGVTVRRSGR